MRDQRCLCPESTVLVLSFYSGPGGNREGLTQIRTTRKYIPSEMMADPVMRPHTSWVKVNAGEYHRHQ
jgi:hypothetical protein